MYSMIKKIFLITILISIANAVSTLSKKQNAQQVSDGFIFQYKPNYYWPNSLPNNNKFELSDTNFLMNGKPFQIISGEMHYPRIPRGAWRQRFQMAKAMGLNTISTYIFWNVHQP